ncbi:hypothetical protein MFFC18_06560 [Mariniblastus fucicola]|uniref:Uncharacterized protein n=1 Tax=Mariniblastus fucicola TaxID=980251 RepID=A0A5B9P6J7_9BACT|nr:hypothetical protein MFFC18_06560 [Mariniblastus fucicola]
MTKISFLAALLAITIPTTCCEAQSLGYSNNRIAMSFDGNSAPDNEYKWPTGDPDDWGALPASCAIMAKLGLQEQLVHCSYNNFIDAPAGPDVRNQLKIGADGVVKHWGFGREVFFDVTTQKQQAIESLAKEMGKSTETDPLYFIHAGLSEFVYLAVKEVIRNGETESLSHVHLVSHSAFNENERRREHHHTWNDIQKLAEGRKNTLRSGTRITKKTRTTCGTPGTTFPSGTGCVTIRNLTYAGCTRGSRHTAETSLTFQTAACCSFCLLVMTKGVRRSSKPLLATASSTARHRPRSPSKLSQWSGSQAGSLRKATPLRVAAICSTTGPTASRK